MKVVVTGMPRSGTSMMMRCLVEGGVEIGYKPKKHNDKEKYIMRNPYGLYESSNRKTKPFTCIKCFDCHYLRDTKGLKVIFMMRDPVEMRKSWDEIELRGKRKRNNTIEKMVSTQQKRLEAAKTNETIIVGYNDFCQNPAEWLEKINDFLGEGFNFNPEKAISGFDENLYKDRRVRC